ncbi:MAG: LON peptidase substrate-binding domain-containing protein [Acetobacteraceae bacterium]|nr:LON peptidase substrate-binding domain-containing protein [Acetobacteraceae bacterium]
MPPAFHPRFSDLPAEIAIFPLDGALLLPGGRLPLNIFEPRYLAMTEDALAHGRMFGMIQPNPQEPQGTTGPGLYRIGCLGRLSQFEETDDGRLLITLSGLIRFAIVEELAPHQGGFRRARADYGAYAADLEPAAITLDRPELEAAMRAYFRAQGISVEWNAIAGTPDPMLLTTLSMACPFEPREKQALLEAETPARRAAMLIALMQIGAASAPPSASEDPSRSKLS